MRTGPGFKLEDAPEDRGNYPIPGLLVEVSPQQWVAMRDNASDEMIELSRVQSDVGTLFNEIAAQQHRYVMDMKDSVGAPEPEVHPPEPEVAVVQPPLESPPFDEAKLYQSVAGVLADHEQFSKLPASDFTEIVSGIVMAVFDG